jgi:hypothetical protein
MVDRAGFEPAALRSSASAFPHSGSKDDLPSGRSSASLDALCTRLIYRPTETAKPEPTIKWVLFCKGFTARNHLQPSEISAFLGIRDGTPARAVSAAFVKLRKDSSYPRQLPPRDKIVRKDRVQDTKPSRLEDSNVVFSPLYDTRGEEQFP